MALKLGYLLPTRARIMVGKHDVQEILDLGDLADEIGIDSVWIGDSLLAKPRHDPLALIGAIAGRTKRVKMGTAVLLPCCAIRYYWPTRWRPLTRSPQAV